MTGFVLAAILLLARAPAADPAKDRPRLEVFASELAAGVGDGAPFTGPAAREAAALALVAIASHESGFAQAVIDCRQRGDGGRSVTAWQLNGPIARGGLTVAEVCASVTVAARAALGVLALHAGICRRGGPLAWMRGYASSHCGVPAQVKVAGKIIDPDVGATMCRSWERLALKAGLVGADCGARGPIYYGPSWASAK